MHRYTFFVVSVAFTVGTLSDVTMWEGALSDQIPTDLGQDPAAALKIMMGAWGDLVRNTTTLGCLVSITYDLV